MAAINYSIDAAALNGTKNMFPITSDGFIQVTGGYDYVSVAQSLAASSTVTFVLPEGLLGIYFATVEATPFDPAYSVGSMGTVNTALVNATGGFCNTLVVPGGTWTVACVATGITITASAGTTTKNVVLALNKLGSAA
jgi:hypothetical protein